jgi:hypothetical protein
LSKSVKILNLCFIDKKATQMEFMPIAYIKKNEKSKSPEKDLPLLQKRFNR